MKEGGRELPNIGHAPLVYLVDDDDEFREEMLVALTGLGLEIHGFGSASAFYRAYAALPPEIVVLDVGLEGEDGLSIAAHLRSSQTVGIIMATARGAIDDKLDGLRSGADIYLVKPIDARELAATIISLCKRLEFARHESASPTSEWALVEGGWVLTDGLGHRLQLTTAERLLIGRLFLNRGAIVDRKGLVEALGEDIYEFNYANIDTIISRLRQRAKKSHMVLPLHAVRGKGFTFAD